MWCDVANGAARGRRGVFSRRVIAHVGNDSRIDMNGRLGAEARTEKTVRSESGVIMW